MRRTRRLPSQVTGRAGQTRGRGEARSPPYRRQRWRSGVGRDHLDRAGQGRGRSPGEARDGHVSRRRVVRADPFWRKLSALGEIACVGDVLLRVVAADRRVRECVSYGDDCEETRIATDATIPGEASASWLRARLAKHGRKRTCRPTRKPCPTATGACSLFPDAHAGDRRRRLPRLASGRRLEADGHDVLAARSADTTSSRWTTPRGCSTKPRRRSCSTSPPRSVGSARTVRTQAVTGSRTSRWGQRPRAGTTPLDAEARHRRHGVLVPEVRARALQ